MPPLPPRCIMIVKKSEHQLPCNLFNLNTNCRRNQGLFAPICETCPKCPKSMESSVLTLKKVTERFSFEDFKGLLIALRISLQKMNSQSGVTFSLRSKF